MARDVTEERLQSARIGSSGIACVVTIADGVGGKVVGTSGHESAFSSVHNNNNNVFMFMKFYSKYRRKSYLILPEM